MFRGRYARLFYRRKAAQLALNNTGFACVDRWVESGRKNSAAVLEELRRIVGEQFPPPAYTPDDYRVILAMNAVLLSTFESMVDIHNTWGDVAEACKVLGIKVVDHAE